MLGNHLGPLLILLSVLCTAVLILGDDNNHRVREYL